MKLTFGQLATLLHICQDPVAFFGEVEYTRIRDAYNEASLGIAKLYCAGTRDNLEAFTVEINFSNHTRDKVHDAATNIRADMDSLVGKFGGVTEPIITPEFKATTGCFDRNGVELFLGDKVRYIHEGPHTRKEYWNPEYEVIWAPPSFTLKHIGGGKDGGSHAFILRCGGANGYLVKI